MVNSSTSAIIGWNQLGEFQPENRSTNSNSLIDIQKEQLQFKITKKTNKTQSLLNIQIEEQKQKQIEEELKKEIQLQEIIWNQIQQEKSLLKFYEQQQNTQQQQNIQQQQQNIQQHQQNQQTHQFQSKYSQNFVAKHNWKPKNK